MCEVAASEWGRRMSEKMTREEIRDELYSIEDEIDELEDRKRDLAVAQQRPEDEQGRLLVGDACLCCELEERKMLSLFCMECHRKTNELLSMGRTPLQIACGNAVIARRIQVFQENQKAHYPLAEVTP